MAGLFETLFRSQGWKQAQLAARMGVAQSTIHRMLRGDIHPGTARKAAPILGIDDWRMLLPGGKKK